LFGVLEGYGKEITYIANLIVMQFRYFLIVGLLFACELSSCCEPATKNSMPSVIDSLFQASHGHDVDIFTTGNSTIPDSGYYPIYTFGIENTGSEDDDFTIQLRYNAAGGLIAGFDITKHVPAGKTVLFKTPVMPPDSITINATYFYPNLTVADTNPPMAEAYFGLFKQTPDSIKIQLMRPTITILYGAINNGPEACNTPAASYPVNIDELPQR
jgi:hypothetical protein